MGNSAQAAGGATPAEPARPRTRILFVDDEPHVLAVLRAGMNAMAREWETQFVHSGEEALALMEQEPFDVVVSDMRMPGMNGAQLLNQVLRRHPRTIRIILSGYSDIQDAMSCVGVVHQFLQKPCGLVELRACLKRHADFNTRLSSERLRTLAGSLSNLPSVPELYLEMLEVVQSPSASVQRIAEIASRDPALSARLLQLSNSAFFGASREVYLVEEAVQLLGVSVIQSLALALRLFHAFDQSKCPSFPLEQVWEHSARTGLLARRLAGEYLGDSQLAEQAFAAGVLHDVGKLILADNLPAEYTQVLAEARLHSRPLFQAERDAFHGTHADVGAYLLALWSLPLPLVEAVANHHEPGRSHSGRFDLVGVVHAANCLQHEQKGTSAPDSARLDLDYLKAVGMADQVEGWRREFLDERTE